MHYPVRWKIGRNDVSQCLGQCVDDSAFAAICAPKEVVRGERVMTFLDTMRRVRLDARREVFGKFGKLYLVEDGRTPRRWSLSLSRRWQLLLCLYSQTFEEGLTWGAALSPIASMSHRVVLLEPRIEVLLGRRKAAYHFWRNFTLKNSSPTVRWNRSQKPLVNRLVEERTARGPFRSFHDLLARVRPEVAQVRLLIKATASLVN
jgi:hypothetical protein